MRKNVLLTVAAILLACTPLLARQMLFTIKNYRAVGASVRVTCCTIDDETIVQDGQKIMVPCGGEPIEDRLLLVVRDDFPLKIVVEYSYYAHDGVTPVVYTKECCEPVAGYWHGADIELHDKLIGSADGVTVKPFHGYLSVHNKTNCTIAMPDGSILVTVHPDRHVVLKKYDWYWQNRMLFPIILARTQPEKLAPYFEQVGSALNEMVVCELPEVFHQGAGTLVMAFGEASFSINEGTSELVAPTFPVAFFYATARSEGDARDALITDNFAFFRFVGHCFVGELHPRGQFMQLALQRPDADDSDAA